MTHIKFISNLCILFCISVLNVLFVLCDVFTLFKMLLILWAIFMFVKFCVLSFVVYVCENYPFFNYPLFGYYYFYCHYFWVMLAIYFILHIASLENPFLSVIWYITFVSLFKYFLLINILSSCEYIEKWILNATICVVAGGLNCSSSFSIVKSK